MNPPQFTLKLIVLVHFILTVWATMNTFMGTSYFYMNMVLMVFGAWSIAQHESADTVLMFLACHLFSIVQDIVLLAINEPRGHNAYENGGRTHRDVNEYRFSLGMSIANLIIKPVTAILLYRIYKDRGGSYGDFNIPGVSNLPGFGGSPTTGRNYENIDEPMPPNVPPQGQGPTFEHQPYEAPPQQPYNTEKAPLH